MVQEGTLKVGDMVVAGPYFGRVKAMFNERNQKIDKAGPSTPLLLLGLNGAPQAGERFKIYEDEDEAKTVANRRMQIVREQGIRTKKHITLEEIGRRKALGTFRELNIIIKADVDGSAEALTDSLMKLSTPEVQVNVIFKGVGQITESDIMLASASDAVIVGFQVRPSSAVRTLADKEGVEIRLYSIIYKAIEEVKDAMEGLLAPKVEEKVTCTVEIRDLQDQQGGYHRRLLCAGWQDHPEYPGAHHPRWHRSAYRYPGIPQTLQRRRERSHCRYGVRLNINNFNDIQVGDIIEGFEEVEVKRKL